MVGLHCGVYFYENSGYVSDLIARLPEVSVLPYFVWGGNIVCVLRQILGNTFNSLTRKNL